jgi:hypothetical protein
MALQEHFGNARRTAKITVDLEGRMGVEQIRQPALSQEQQRWIVPSAPTFTPGSFTMAALSCLRNVASTSSSSEPAITDSNTARTIAME